MVSAQFTSPAAPDELDRPLNPLRQLVIFLDALRLDQHPIPHRPAGEVKFPDVRLQSAFVTIFRVEPDNLRVFPDADKRVAVNEDALSLISS